MTQRPRFAPWEDPTATPLITFQNVTKRYGDFTAIEDLNLAIYPREFFALLGPSGCGKTTIMRMLGGFEEVTSGTIRIDGQDMKGIPPNKRAVNMMFQSYALFPHLTVWDNIAFGLKRSDMPKDQIGERVEEMLRLTQLQKFARRKPHQLSGGQKQRVALARSLAKAPKLLLLDEPLGALDKKLRQQTQFELVDIQEKTGTTFVIVTHDQEEAMTMASRIAVMDHGKVIQVEAPDRIYEQPASVYVADFLGEVSVIPGRVAQVGEEVSTLDWAEGATPLQGQTGPEIAPGEEAHFVIRPEKVSISKEEPLDADYRVEGVVQDIAYLGNTSTYFVRLPGGQLVKSMASNVRRVSLRDITWEDRVWLSWRHTAGMILKE